MNRVEQIGQPSPSDQLEALRSLLRLGDLARLVDDVSADLLTGLTIARPIEQAQAFGVPLPRPQLPPEAACGTWPPETSNYTPSGQVSHPQVVLRYPLVQVGYALTCPEVKAALLGLLAAGPLNCAQLLQLRETFDALARGKLQELISLVQKLEKAVSSTGSTSTTITIPAPLPSAVIDTDGQPGDVVRWNGSGHLEVATGTDLADQETVVGLLGEAWTAGQVAQYYPTGTKTPPIAGVPRGRVYRHRDGSATYSGALIVDDWSLQVGIANADGRIDVVIDAQDFIVEESD